MRKYQYRYRKTQEYISSTGWGVTGTIADKIYFLNSHTNPAANQFVVFDPINKTWNLLSHLAVSRQYSRGEILHGQLIFIGGQNDLGTDANLIEVYTPFL